MPRRLGPYAPLSATYASDDAMIEAGEAAELLYCRGLAFCASSDSDGFISDAQLARYVGVGMKDTAKRAAKLVAVGLWGREPGGYVVRSWLKWNASAEELGKARKRDRERKARGNPSPDPDGLPPDSERNPDGIQTESRRNPDGIHPRADTRAPTRRRDAPPNHSTTQHITALAHPTKTGNGLLDEHVAACVKPPPRDLRQKLGVAIDALIDDGIDPDDVRAGLAKLRAKPHLGPGLLSQLVNEAMNAPPEPGSVRRSEIDRMFG